MKVSERRIVWVKRGGAGGGSVGWSEAGALSQLGIRPAGYPSLSLSLCLMRSFRSNFRGKWSQIDRNRQRSRVRRRNATNSSIFLSIHFAAQCPKCTYLYMAIYVD